MTCHNHLLQTNLHNSEEDAEQTRVKSGIFGQTAKFGQRPYLFYISNIRIKIN